MGPQKKVLNVTDTAPLMTFIRSKDCPHVPVPEGTLAAFRNLVLRDTLETTMEQAYEYTQNRFTGSPCGNMATIKTPQQVKSSASVSVPTLFSGVISALRLEAPAHASPDVGRATAMLENCATCTISSKPSAT